MLSKRALYALRALIVLAQVEPAAMNISDIAARQQLPRKFLEAILLSLKHAGLCVSARGREGGYALARPAEEITVADVLRAVDGPLALMPCASVTRYQPCQDCDDVRECAVRLTMRRVRDAVSDILDQMTVADMLSVGNVKRGALVYHI